VLQVIDFKMLLTPLETRRNKRNRKTRLLACAYQREFCSFGEFKQTPVQQDAIRKEGVRYRSQLI
jgi:hypothetical protein